jgi:hypothetical protein
MITSPALTFGLIRTTDRCDRCSAQARAIAVLDAGGELFFCGHHARTYRAALQAISVWIEDDAGADTVPAAA